MEIKGPGHLEKLDTSNILHWVHHTMRHTLGQGDRPCCSQKCLWQGTVPSVPLEPRLAFFYCNVVSNDNSISFLL